MPREFHLSPPGRGVSCDTDGAFVVAVPMLSRLRKNDVDEWQPRDCAQISEQLTAYYGLPIDISSKRGGLKAIAKALNDGDVVRAQIATVLLGIPDPPDLSKDARSQNDLIKLVGDLSWSGMLKWDSDEHPRWPAGSDDSKGGQFAPKGEGDASGTSLSDVAGASTVHDRGSTEAEGGSRDPRIQLADAGMSDASDDPMREAVAHAALIAGHHSDAAQVRAVSGDGKHDGFWQRLGSQISDDAKTALSQIGRAEQEENNANVAVGVAQANEIAQLLSSYAEYRRQPWMGRNGKPISLPVFNDGDPESERVAMIGHVLFDPSIPLRRPATNADWIDALVDYISLGASVARPAAGLATSAIRALNARGATVAAERAALAAAENTPFVILPKELPPSFDIRLPIGRYTIPTGAVPGTTKYGELVGDQIGKLIQGTIPDAKLILRTGPGVKGVDIEVPVEDVPDFGFRFGEIKPLSNSGYTSFSAQIARWKLPEPVLPITYDYEGNIYFGFPR